MSIRDQLMASLESALQAEVPNEDYYDNLMEVEETAKELNESLIVVDELGGAAESVESICDSLESHIADGGMEPQTVISHNVAMENIHRKLGLSSNHVSLSLESFTDDSSRLTASQEALEGARALLKRIWEGIKKAWDTAVSYLKKFWAAVRNAFSSVKGKTKELKEEAKQADQSGTPPEVDFSPIAKATEDNSTEVKGALGALLRRAKEVQEQANEARISLDELAAAARAGDMEKFDELMTDGRPAKVKEKAKQSPRYSNKYRKANKDTSGIVSVEVKKKGLTASEVVAAANDIEKLADEVAKIENTEVKQVVSSSEKLVKSLETAISKIENDPGKIKQLSNAASEVRALSAAISNSSADYVRECLKTSAAVITVSKKSLRKAS